MLAVAAMGCSLSANAQLTSADNGAAATDTHGLMWANTVGTNLTWSSTGAAGSAQAWVAGLNASDYGGHDDWTLATGNGSFGANTMTNQLGELFYTDCGNSLGTPSVLSNPGSKCTALSTLNNVITSSPIGSIFFSGSLYGTTCCDIYQTYWWVYQTPASRQQAWNFDSNFYFQVGTGDALAVRKVNAAPEIDPASAASGLTLLLGALAVLRGRRASTAKALTR